MTLQELIALYRAQSKDEANAIDGGTGDVLCSDELLTIYADEALAEACRRGDLLRDSTSAMAVISYAADAESVALDSRVVRILRGRTGGQELEGVDAETMDAMHPGWQDSSLRSTPQRLVSGLSTGKLFLWPRPAQAGVLRLTVQRLPLMRFQDGCDTPEIAPELHACLVDWMLYRAYSREDTDLYNDTKAALALGRFEAEFGRKASGRNEAWMRSGAQRVPGPIA